MTARNTYLLYLKTLEFMKTHPKYSKSLSNNLLYLENKYKELTGNEIPKS